MKRYNCYYSENMVEDPTGEWVERKEVERFIATIRAAFMIIEISTTALDALKNLKDMTEMLKLFNGLKELEAKFKDNL